MALWSNHWLMLPFFETIWNGYLDLTHRTKMIIGFIVLFLIISVILLIFILISRGINNRDERRKEQFESLFESFIMNIMFEEDLEMVARHISSLKEQCDTAFKKKIAVHLLLDYQRNFSGEAQERLCFIYERMGLGIFLSEELRQSAWEKKAHAARAMSLMSDDREVELFIQNLNHKVAEVRNESTFALIRLQGVQAFQFLHGYQYYLNLWQQIRMIELIDDIDNSVAPDLEALLKSENQSVKAFAIRLIYYFNASYLVPILEELIKEPLNEECVTESLKVFEKYQYADVVPFYKANYANYSPKNRLIIIRLIGVCSFDDAHFEFLKQHYESGSFEEKIAITQVVDEIDERLLDELITDKNEEFEMIVAHAKDDRI